MKKLASHLVRHHRVLLWVVAVELLFAALAFFTPPEGLSGPVRINDLSALEHAIFIRDNGHEADLLDSLGHKLPNSALIASAPLDSGHHLVEYTVKDGKPDSTIIELPPVPRPNFERYQYFSRIIQAFDRSGKKHLLLWIHGGRNTLGESPNRTLELVRAIDTTAYYPICINWQSNDFISYWNHLTYNRPAKRGFIERVFAALKVPLLLPLDFARGMIRTPYTAYGDVARIWTSTFCSCDSIHRQIDGLTYSRGAATDSPSRFARAAWAAATMPIRTAVMVPINAIGPGEWESLCHSTQAMFETDQDLFKTSLPTPAVGDSGALSIFLDDLDDYLKDHPDVHVTLIAHSMGTIVASEMLRHHPDFPASSIVYMAAACRAHELYDSIVPFLARHMDTRFYNLMLHQHMDLDETGFPIVGSYLYQGSLLTWIDDFLSTEEAPLSRVLGRDENAMAVARLVPLEVRSRVTFKTFGCGDSLEIKEYGAKGVPLQHGQFSDPNMHFWEPKFWEGDSLSLIASAH